MGVRQELAQDFCPGLSAKRTCSELLSSSTWLINSHCKSASGSKKCVALEESSALVAVSRLRVNGFNFFVKSS